MGKEEKIIKNWIILRRSLKLVKLTLLTVLVLTLERWASSIFWPNPWISLILIQKCKFRIKFYFTTFINSLFVYLKNYKQHKSRPTIAPVIPRTQTLHGSKWTQSPLNRLTHLIKESIAINASSQLKSQITLSINFRCYWKINCWFSIAQDYIIVYL